MKTANLTVRIDPELKRLAQESAEFLDVSLSQVVTAALHGLIRQSDAHRTWLGEFKSPQPQHPCSPPVHARIQEVGEGFADRAAKSRAIERRQELEALEKRNKLNPATRAELKQLRNLWVVMP